MPDPRFRAIIFDFDGLIVDTEPLYGEATHRLAGEYGITVTQATLQRIMGRSRIDSMRIFAQDGRITRSTPEELLERREQIMMEFFARGVPPMRGLHNILNRFHGRLKLGIATNSPKKFNDILLPALKVDHFFQVIQAGDEVTNGKPDPEVYLRAMSRLGCQPNECIVLEDSPNGTLAGQRAGAYVIAVPSPLTEQLDFPAANETVKHLDEAADRIEELLKGG